MQNRTYKGTTKSVDSFDDEVSLWNLVGGNGLRLLQQIADTEYLIEKRDRPLSLLLSGRQSAIIYSVCFLRSLAMQVSQIPAPLLFHRDGLVEFFTPSHPDRGYIIEDIDFLNLGIIPKILQIIETGEFNQYDYSRKCVETCPVYGIVIMTCQDIKRVMSHITKSVDHVIHIDDLNREQIREIIKMRLRWAYVEYENENVIDMLATGNSLRPIIAVLKIAIVNMLSGGRSYLTEQDIVGARDCL